MHTLSIDIEDDYMQQFLKFVRNSQSNITITKDKNLEFDPYFYERKKELEEIIKDCENGTMELLSQDQYDSEMEIFFKDLKSNANL
jgi:5,10-methylenetetrahydrofolate reductase